MPSQKVDDLIVIFTNTQKKVYNYLMKQPTVSKVIRIGPDGKWAILVLNGEETIIDNPLVSELFSDYE
jgi:hypothetical protein